MPAYVVPLPIVATDAPVPPPRPGQFMPWLLDTAFSGEAHVALTELRNHGLDPNVPMLDTGLGVSAFGQTRRLFERKTALWLFGNLPHLVDRPIRLRLRGGLSLSEPDASPATHYLERLPLIGNRLLHASGIRTDIDFRRRVLSVWVPAPWYRNGLDLLGRVRAGFATTPVRFYAQ